MFWFFCCYCVPITLLCSVNWPLYADDLQGSCNQVVKRVWFNLELAIVDDYSLDYVVMYELAHLKIRNLEKKFIQILKKHMSDWEQRRS
jgi:predicted metal-dependent hydrolase